ncbi:unnamed protein product [Acanthoscelides obtectus]|uniref:Uncharacterized protein n=1 Tax=Acanthoscelides obtectus TaxID=200917 RepID=A0A9P0K1R4_ACAOB|nr:unnamed protein product [Acanthoscelides obtectus]CAK1658699.1 hypothetical protein AOBTE_LOCUS21072 [Acanthoscelides obtectus]
MPIDGATTTIDSNAESSAKDGNVVEISATEEVPEDERKELSIPDQNIGEHAAEDEEKSDNPVIEPVNDEVTIVETPDESPEDIAEVPAQEITVDAETSTANEENVRTVNDSTDTVEKTTVESVDPQSDLTNTKQIPKEPSACEESAEEVAPGKIIAYDEAHDNAATEADVAIENQTAIEPVEAETELVEITEEPEETEATQNETASEIVEAKDTEVAIEEPKESETTENAVAVEIEEIAEIIEEPDKVEASQNETAVDTVAVDTEETSVVGIVEEPKESEPSQDESAIEAAAVETEETEVVEVTEELKEDEELPISSSSELTETIESAKNIPVVETTNEDNVESVPDKSEPTKEMANIQAEDLKDERIDSAKECDIQGDVIEEINDCTSSVAEADPAVSANESENNLTEATSIPEEAVSEDCCIGNVEESVKQTTEVPNECSSRGVEEVAEQPSPGVDVKAAIYEETEAAVDSLGALIEETIRDTSNAPDESIDDAKGVEDLEQGSDAVALDPEDETEAAVKSLGLCVNEPVEAPPSMPIQEIDISPEYEETEAAVAALTSNELPYSDSPEVLQEPVVYSEETEMTSVDDTTKTHDSEPRITEEMIENQATASAVDEVESDVTSDQIGPIVSSISAAEEAINAEESRAAVEAVMSIANETYDSSSQSTISKPVEVSDDETYGNKGENPDEAIPTEITTEEETPGIDAVTSSVENTDVEMISIPIPDYKSPKSVGGATAMSHESEEEMEALALEPSPLAPIEEVEEPEEKESQEKNEALHVDMQQSAKKPPEIEAFEKAAESTIEGSKAEAEAAELKANEANIEAVTDSDVVQVVENNVSDKEVIEEIKSTDLSKEATAAAETNSIEKESIENVNLLQTVEAESSEKITNKDKEHKKAIERPRRGKRATPDSKLEELSINVDLPDKEKPYSPKVTIKPIKVPDEEISTTSNADSEVGKGCLKMTITKQSDNTHSILKICDSDATGSEAVHEEGHIPKLRIKSVLPSAEQHSPKSKNKQPHSPTGSSQKSSNPRVTIKPVVKPEVGPLKIKIGLKGDESTKKASPKMKAATDEDSAPSPKKAKSAAKSVEEPEQHHSPRITIKPIPKPEVEGTKLRLKMHEEDEQTQGRSSPKITIKPIVKPQESEEVHDEDDGSKERIVLKINKGNLPTKDEKSEKLAKITLKLSKEGSAHIVQQPEENQKRPIDESVVEKNKRQKTEPAMETRSRHKGPDMPVESSRSNPTKHIDPTESPIEAKRSKLSPSPARDSRSKEVLPHDDVKVIEERIESPIVISEDSRSQDSGSCILIEDTASEHSQRGLTPDSERKIEAVIVDSSEINPPETKKRGRPRKRKGAPVETVEHDPLQQVEEQSSLNQTPPPAPKQTATTKQIATSKQIAAAKQAAQAKQVAAAKAASATKNVAPPKNASPPTKAAPPVQAVHESGRPKRSCRGQSAIDVLGIKPRKPRQPSAAKGGGKGGKKGAAEVKDAPESSEPKTSVAASPQGSSPAVVLVKNLEVAVPAGDRDKSEPKSQQAGKKVEPPQKQRRSAEPTQRRSAEPQHVEALQKTEEPIHNTRKSGTAPQTEKKAESPLKEKRSERRSAEPVPKVVPQKEEQLTESPQKKIKPTEVSPKEVKQVDLQQKLVKATETPIKRAASTEPPHRLRSADAPEKDDVAKPEEPPNKQRKITDSTKTLSKEVSVAQKHRTSIESKLIEKLPEVSLVKKSNPIETEAKLTEEVIHVETTDPPLTLTENLVETPQQAKSPALSVPLRKLSTETPKRPIGALFKEHRSFPLSKPMLVDEIIDLDPDPPEAPKVAPVEIEVRPVEVKVRSQIARRGGRRGVGGRRPTTERRVVTVPEVEDKSSTETTPLRF